MPSKIKTTSPIARLSALPRDRKPHDEVQAQQHIRAVAPSSPVYAKVQATLTAWNLSTDALSALVSQQSVAEQQLLELRVKVRDAEQQFRLDEHSFRGAVQMASQGQAALITSLGYGVVEGATAAATTVTAPTALVAVPGVDPGGVHLRWVPPLKGKRSFAVQVSPDPVSAASWKSLDGTTRRTLKVGDLTSGARYWFRVATIAVGTQSAWTDPVSATAR